MNQQTTQPLITVIIPVYNGGRYLEELVRQFAGQPMENIELLFVDDGSTDDTWQKLLEIAGREAYPVSAYHQENRGVSAARNLGMEKARGSYIAFLDVDDGVSPDYIATLKAQAADGAELTVFASRRVKEGFVRELSPEKPWEELTGEQMLFRFWADPTRLGVCNLLVSREFLTEHGITSPVGYKYYEDYDLLLQLFAKAEKVRFLDRVLYYYILRDGSAMGRFTAERINCLKLMKQRGLWLREYAPGFAAMFEEWGTSRLYWSVLWQAALALPAYRDFQAFAEATYAGAYLRKLKGHPDWMVQISTLAFLCCKPAYHLAVRLLGRRKSKVEPARLAELLESLDEDIQFY